MTKTKNMELPKVYTTKIHLYPSKMRLACYGKDNSGNTEDGFFILKRKNDYYNSQGKMINYSLCFSIRGRITESAITEETFNALKKEAKKNFEVAFANIVDKGEKLEKIQNG
jgi:hypothetical protein